MAGNKQDEEELLLIVSGMGERIANENRYLIGSECADCVADLQRYLRRDDPIVMAAHRALGSWHVLQTHLIPLLQATCDSDVKLSFNVLKLIVKLTMKPEQLSTLKFLPQHLTRIIHSPYASAQPRGCGNTWSRRRRPIGS